MTGWFRSTLALLAVWAIGCGGDDAAAPQGFGGTAGSAGAAGSAGSAGSAGNAGTGATGPSDEQILAASWQVLPNAPQIQGKQDDLYFLTPERGVSVNGLGQLHATTDGGDSFVELVSQPGTYFRSVLMLDENHGFIGNIGTNYFPGVTDTTPLYETFDGGKSLTPVTNISGPVPAGICNMTKLDDGMHVFAVGRVGGPSYFMKSTDGGASWSSVDLTSQIGMLIDVRFHDENRGLLIGGTSTTSPYTIVLSTTDGGATWSTAFQSQHPGELGWKFSFPSELVGYASVIGQSSPSTFLKTTDGGATWQELTLTDASYSAKGIGFITENIGWIGGENPGGAPALRTSDGGATWQEAPGLGPLINRFRFVGGYTGYAIGMSIHKLEISGG